MPLGGSAKQEPVSHDDNSFRILQQYNRMPANRADAEDAAQDPLSTAWRPIGRFRHDAIFTTWLKPKAKDPAVRGCWVRAVAAVRVAELRSPTPISVPDSELRSLGLSRRLIGM